MEKKVSSSSKFRSLKEFLSSTRSLNHHHHQNYESSMKKPSHTAHTPSFRSSIRNTKNSISLFNLIAASGTASSPSNNGGYDRPISIALDDQFGYAYEDREAAPRSLLPSKSVSMYGLSPVDIPSSAESSNLHTSPSTRNLAARLFYNLKSKFRRRRRDRSKIVDSKSTDFGTLFPEEQSKTSPASTSFPNSSGDLNNLKPTSARYKLKSANSLDTILDASNYTNNGAMINNDLTEKNYQNREDNNTSARMATGCSTNVPSSTSSTRSNNRSFSLSLKLLAEPVVAESNQKSRSQSGLLRHREEDPGRENSSALTPTPHSNSNNRNEPSDTIPPTSTSVIAAPVVATQSISPSKPVKCLTKELDDLLRYGWYWCGLSKEEAEEKLKGEPDGAFVVRDSSSNHYLLSLSFNSKGETLHTRIEYSNGQFCFYMSPSDSFNSVAELIQHCIRYSKMGVFCYSMPRRRNDIETSYPVRLTKPISRFTEVKSLFYLCRQVIRHNVRFDLIPLLPLPPSVIEFVSEQKYI